ncbi:MAG: hypothetical protein PUJ93_06885, partial [Oscillospiraceae bacterium]|nr:hypothetical protein [Oscillospiraceae bacterium]MDY5735407.1 hypothetical protein [Oscillospiraceae bacterium]
LSHIIVTRIQGVPWEKQVDGYFNGDGTQKRSDSLYVGESNVKGVEKAPLYIPTSVITKATREQQGSRSAHGMTENFIKNSIFLYLDPQKNRTDTWFHSLRLQLPSGKTMYGSIGRISYADGDVKIQGVPWEKLVDGYFNGDGMQKRSDSLYVGEANVNPMIDNLGSDATIHIRNEKKLNQMLPGNQILKSLELLAKVKLDSDSIANNSDSVKQNLSERVTHHCNTYRRIKFSTDIGLNECTNCDKLKSTKANARRTAAAYQTLQNRKWRKDHENCCPVRKRRSVPAFWTCCRI